MGRVVIVGSGLAGLACAAALAGQIECFVVERLPVAGGEHWDQPRIRELLGAAVAGGVELVAATQAIRWDGARVTLVGERSAVQRAEVLVVATGHRPLTRAELGIGGSRCGGILPGTVAEHLVAHDVTIGYRPLIVGAGRLALGLTAAMLKRGCEVHLAIPAETDDPHGWRGSAPGSLAGLQTYPGGSPTAVQGEARVERVRLSWKDGRELDLACDALILAHGRIPYRNIDGAVFDAPGVLFAQSAAEPEWLSESTGKATAEAALTLLGRPSDEFLVPPRIGVPA